ncbi:MAG TPA: PAS domain S-box protein [Spirochaetota bacterium]|nr:PAS domain S-box protein [Spirochaetota bacterium]HPI89592.1 PAS domain S-box protein [Spirochaetota bacterium]HPR48051.1 PAS domain S-box protein [Spirochaetota bacterium]
MKKSFERKTILLVEDEIITAMTQSKVIEGFGYEVISVHSGNKAVAIALDNKNIDLILMDIDLGEGIDGTEAAKIIHESRDIPIIFLTSHAEKEMVEKVRGITRYGYVIKESGSFVLQSSIEMAFELYNANLTARESEARFSRVFSQSAIGIAIVSTDFHYVKVNDAFCRMTQYSEEELQGLTFLDVTHPDHAGQDLEQVTKLLEGKIDQYITDKKYIRRDGSFFWGHVNVRLMKDEKGHPLYYLPMIEDITERKQNEIETQKNNARLRSIVRMLELHSPDVQQFLDHALDEAIKITESRIGYIYFYNENKKEFVLNTWSKDVMKECTIMNPQTCYELEKTGIWGEAVRQRREIIINDFEAHHPLKKGYPQGHVKLHKFMTVPIIKNNAIVAVIGVANKITDYTERDVLELRLLMDSVWKEVERRQWERALQNSEQNYRDIFNATSDALFILDEQGNILDFNERGAELYQYSKEDLLASPFSLLGTDIGPCTANRIEQKIRDVILSGQCTFECRTIGKTQNVFESEVALTVSTIAGEKRIIASLRDITERKNAERLLIESEKKYEVIFNGAAEGILIASMETKKFLYSNPTICSMLGYTSDELRNMSVKDIHPPEDLPFVYEVFESESTDMMQLSPEIPCLRKDGSIFYANINTSRISIDDTPCNVGLFTDVTERKKYKDQILSMSQRFNDIIESIPDAVFVIDREKKVVAWNRAIEEISGVKKEYILGKGNHEYAIPIYGKRKPMLVDLLDEPDKEAESCYKYVIRSDNKILAETYNPNLYGGRGAHLWGVATPLFDKDGNRFGSIEVIKDVTDIVLKEEALLKSEKRYSEILEEIDDGYYEVDLEGNLTFFNNAMAKIIGYTRDELKGVNYRSFMDNENAKKVLATFNQVYRSKVPARAFDWELTRKDGTTCFVETSVSLLRHDSGNPAGFHGLARDVTLKKNLEEQLLQAQKMESIGKLAGGIAHDFNNMLTPIMGYAQMLLDQHSADDPRRENVEQIMHSAERSRDLVRQLLAFARKQTLEMNPVSLNVIIENFEKMLRRTLHENVSIETDLDPESGLILADTGQVEQVLLNLSVNAQDAMPDGGTLYIKTGTTLFDESAARLHQGSGIGPYVTLTVSDTGQGMNKLTLTKVFDPFFTTKGYGTGLGLSTVYGIVKQHGGYISAQSEQGRGSSFTIYFPMQQEPATAIPDKHHENKTMHGNETILVVEDEPLVRNLVVKMLVSAGYRVYHAENSSTAQSILQENGEAIDLLLTDIMLSSENGKKLFEKLRTIKQNLKVLYMSGYSNEVLGQNFLPEEKTHFIQKPFTLTELSLKIRTALEG